MSRPDVYLSPSVRKPRRDPLALGRLKVRKLGGGAFTSFFGEPSPVSCATPQGCLALDFPPWSWLLLRSLATRSALLLMFLSL